MARFTYKPGQSVTGKNIGVTHYANRYGSFGRANVATLFPATPLQQNANIGMAMVAQAWGALTPSEQNEWAALAPTGTAAYTFFSTYAMRLWAWGLLQYAYFVPTNLSSVATFPYGRCWGDGSRVYFQIFQDQNPGTSTLINAQLYIEPNQLWPQWVPGVTGGTPVNVPQATAYTFIGTMGPLDSSGWQQVDITDAILDFLGQYPMLLDIHYPSEFMEGGSVAAMQWYFTDFAGRLYEPPPATTYPCTEAAFIDTTPITTASSSPALTFTKAIRRGSFPGLSRSTLQKLAQRLR